LSLEVELLLTRSQQLDSERAQVEARAVELERQQSRLEAGRQALKADERWVRGRIATVARRESAVTLCILLNSLAATVLAIWKILG
jgi:hypothetical protein